MNQEFFYKDVFHLQDICDKGHVLKLRFDQENNREIIICTTEEGKGNLQDNKIIQRFVGQNGDPVYNEIEYPLDFTLNDFSFKYILKNFIDNNNKSIFANRKILQHVTSVTLRPSLIEATIRTQTSFGDNLRSQQYLEAISFILQKNLEKYFDLWEVSVELRNLTLIIKMEEKEWNYEDLLHLPSIESLELFLRTRIHNFFTPVQIITLKKAITQKVNEISDKEQKINASETFKELFPQASKQLDKISQQRQKAQKQKKQRQQIEQEKQRKAAIQRQKEQTIKNFLQLEFKKENNESDIIKINEFLFFLQRHQIDEITRQKVFQKIEFFIELNKDNENIIRYIERILTHIPDTSQYTSFRTAVNELQEKMFQLTFMKNLEKNTLYNIVSFLNQRKDIVFNEDDVNKIVNRIISLKDDDNLLTFLTKIGKNIFHQSIKAAILRQIEQEKQRKAQQQRRKAQQQRRKALQQKIRKEQQEINLFLTTIDLNLNQIITFLKKGIKLYENEASKILPLRNDQ